MKGRESMSKRNRNRYRQQNKQTPVVSERKSPASEAGLFANDGYTNSMTYTGEQSKLMNAGGYTRHSITDDIETLTILYRQNWICKRIIDVPSEDMTRSWYSLNTQLDEDHIKELKRQEAKHQIKQEITNAIRWARLYGGSIAVMVISGQEDMLDEPLDIDMIAPDSFKGLIVLDRVVGIEPSIELEENLEDVDYGYPMYYNVYLDAWQSKSVKIHHSRCLVFRGRELPRNEEISQNYFGVSEMEHIYEELRKRDSTSANIAQLVFQSNIRVLKMGDFGEALAMATQQRKDKILNSIHEQNRLVNNFGVQLLSADDSYETHPYTFSGIAEMYEKFMADMAGAAEMPATKLYGRSPDGMNATGDSDMQLYYDSIAQKQENYLRPAIERLLPVMCMSLWGAVPDDLEVVFEPIATVSAADRASLAGTIASNVTSVYSAGLIGRKSALIELREAGKEVGAWQKITDEMIDQASDDVQGSGEEGQDPMAAMMGGQQPAQDDADMVSSTWLNAIRKPNGNKEKTEVKTVTFSEPDKSIERIEEALNDGENKRKNTIKVTQLIKEWIAERKLEKQKKERSAFPESYDNTNYSEDFWVGGKMPEEKQEKRGMNLVNVSDEGQKYE